MFVENNISEEFSLESLFQGRYLIKQNLGEGGQGIVVKALDTKNYDNPVVIKTLRKEITDKWFIDKFKEEQRALAQLQGATGIVKLIDNGKTKDGRDYTILEFIDGKLLTDVNEDLPNNLPRAAALFQQIASAVEYAHLKKIYHRDLKPDNIMVANPGTRSELIKIIDFGIAQQIVGKLTGIELTSAIVGTPFYLSPNALDGKPDAKADDIYALGLIAYTMVTGQYPIPTENFSLPKLLDMQKNIAAYPPSEKNNALSKEVDGIIFKALAEKPSERYASAETFSDDLRRALLQSINDKTKQMTTVIEKRKSNALVYIIPLLLLGVLLGILAWLGIFGSAKKPEDVSNTNVQNSNQIGNTAQTNTNTNLNRNLSENSSGEIKTKKADASPTPVSPDEKAVTLNDFSVEMVKQTENDKSVKSSPAENFKSGEGIRLNITSEKDGVLQIFLKGNDGMVKKVLNANIQANKMITFPNPKWIVFDQNPGTETIYILISKPDAPEKTDVGALDNQSKGNAEFTTEKGSAVRIIKLNHSK